jgi:hypothetical protein
MRNDQATAGLERRLVHFLRVAAPHLKSRGKAGRNQTAHLKAFLTAARPFLQRKNSGRVPHRVNPASLEAALQKICEPLERQRASGRSFNVWSAAGLKRDEVKNTAVLAELLRHERLGTTGRAFLAAILSKARSTVPEFPEIATDGAYRVTTEVCPLGNRETRVDLVIETGHHLIGIEVKIDAIERPGQLANYANILREKAALEHKTPGLIFISPRPPAPSAKDAVHLTWLDIQQTARTVAQQHRSSGHASWLLKNFADHITTFG